MPNPIPDVSSDNPTRPYKRPRAGRACAGCVTAKIRCEDVQSGGCSRCRSRGSLCSLVSFTPETPQKTFASPDLDGRPSDDYHQTVSEIYVHKLEARVGYLEESTKALRDKMVALETRLQPDTMASTLIQDQLSAEVKTKTDGKSSRSVTKQLVPPYTAQNAVPLLSRMNGLNGLPLFAELHSLLFYPQFSLSPDLSEWEMDSCFHMWVPSLRLACIKALMIHRFKCSFSKLVYLPSFLLSTTSTPSHSFIKLAILAYIRPTQDAMNMISASLNAFMIGANDIDSVLALFILSFSPVHRDLDPPPITAHRCASLAYQIGQSWGSDTVAARSLLRGKGYLIEDQWGTKLDNMILVRLPFMAHLAC